MSGILVDEKGEWVYKRQHEFFTDNEIYFYKKMYPTGYVPYAEQVDRDLIKTQYIPQEEVTSAATFLSHLEPLLNCLESANIKHGDLTERAVRVKDNKPYLIDFSESRFIDDPRPDKRPESDRHWLTIAMHSLAKVKNLRFADQWRIVSKHIDFAGKSVLDLGCGYGDMLKAAHQAGAQTAIGVDHDKKVLAAIKDSNSKVVLHHTDINNIKLAINVDIIICFSVLPHLKNPSAALQTLQWISNHSTCALLEVQYKNDGPGTIKDDTEAKGLFGHYWNKVTPIGKTLVDYRNLHRTIWLCKEASKLDYNGGELVTVLSKP